MLVLGAMALLAGFGGGGVILGAYSMMSDAVRYDYITSGLRREGAFAGFTTLFDKLAAAAGIASMGIFLSGMDYVATTAGKVAQPDSAILAVTLSVTVVPAAMMALAIFAIRNYALDETTLIDASSSAVVPDPIAQG